MHSPAETRSRRYGASLEQRLPLLISTLLVATVFVFGAAAYREVRSAAAERASVRLIALARELAQTLAGNTTRAFAILRSRASEEPVVRAARMAGDTAAALNAIALGRAPGDTLMDGLELRGIDGSTRLRTGRPSSAVDAQMLDSLLSDWKGDDSVRRSRLYLEHGALQYWNVAAIEEQGRVVGYLAERRHLAQSPAAGAQIRRLLGEDIEFFITDIDLQQWGRLGGHPVPQPFASLPAPEPGDSATVQLVRDPAGTRHLVSSAVIAGSPWLLVLALDESVVMQRPNDFLRRMLGVAALILILGAFASWLVSRHVTRPLRTVTSAAERLAEGDYAQRVQVTGNHEIAKLADTFNTMAGALGDAHATLADRNAALEQAVQAKAKFLAMMSHELRTPLNAIAGYTELLSLGVRGPVTDAQVEDLARIRRNKDHLLAIIGDILSFARLDAGQLELRMSAFPAQSVLRDVEEMMRAQFAEKGVSFRTDPAPADLLVRADREKLRQILLNLVTNALRFTAPGGSVVMRAGHDAESGMVDISVVDTGVGVPADRLEKIFEPFVQVDSSLTRRVGGTGLGLAIARDLALAMGGTVHVESEEGKGSTFTVRVPAASQGAELVRA